MWIVTWIAFPHLAWNSFMYFEIIIRVHLSNNSKKTWQGQKNGKF